jgi:hypothetical protein
LFANLVFLVPEVKESLLLADHREQGTFAQPNQLVHQQEEPVAAEQRFLLLRPLMLVPFDEPLLPQQS